MKKKEEKKPKTTGFRPIGPRVMVMFNQDDWEVGKGGFITKTGLYGTGFRMDGTVVAVGTKGIPDGVGVGSTVYADPRQGEILRLDGVRYHIMNCADLMAVATQEGK